MSHPASPLPDNTIWYKQLTGYHWFVLIVASAAWFFDCLDQRLFSLARVPALVELLDDPDERVRRMAEVALGSDHDGNTSKVTMSLSKRAISAAARSR